jgi:hypothetical protein
LGEIPLRDTATTICRNTLYDYGLLGEEDNTVKGYKGKTKIEWKGLWKDAKSIFKPGKSVERKV